MAEQTNIDVTKAKIWEQRVNNELDQVKAVISKVNETLQTPAGEDDPIYRAIGQVATTFDGLGKSLVSGFGKVTGTMTGVLGAYEKVIGTAVDLLENVSKKAKI